MSFDVDNEMHERTLENTLEEMLKELQLIRIILSEIADYSIDDADLMGET